VGLAPDGPLPAKLTGCGYGPALCYTLLEMQRVKSLVTFFADTYHKWSDDRAMRMAAALSYYLLFSLAPLLFILTAVLGALAERFLAQGDVSRELSRLLGDVMGQQLADFVLGLAQGPGELSGLSSSLPLISVIGLLIALWGASNIFTYLHEALNTIWGVRPVASGGIIMTLRSRMLAFLIVFIAGALLVLYILANSLISLLIPVINSLLPRISSSLPDFHILQLSQSALLLLITTLLFAAFFRVLPDVEITWRDVFVGAAVTALLFGLGVLILNIYFRFYTTSFAGATGSLIVLMLWFYYSAQIFMFGAEFTYMYATRYGTKITPANYTMAVSRTLIENDAHGGEAAEEEPGESEQDAETPEKEPATSAATNGRNS
jgi:membrane protein